MDYSVLVAPPGIIINCGVPEDESSVLPDLAWPFLPVACSVEAFASVAICFWRDLAEWLSRTARSTSGGAKPSPQADRMVVTSIIANIVNVFIVDSLFGFY